MCESVRYTAISESTYNCHPPLTVVTGDAAKKKLCHLLHVYSESTFSAHDWHFAGILRCKMHGHAAERVKRERA